MVVKRDLWSLIWAGPTADHLAEAIVQEASHERLDYRARLLIHSLEPSGQFQVDLVDAYDIFLSKLFSRREKDRDDLRVLARQLEQAEIERRVREHGEQLAADSALRPNAVDNWFILYGDALPT